MRFGKLFLAASAGLHKASAQCGVVSRHGCHRDAERRLFEIAEAREASKPILQRYGSNGEEMGKVTHAAVTSPIGLHGWKHRFAVNRAHLHRYAGPVGAAAVEIWKHRFARSSNWKHTFAIRSIAVDWQAEEKQRVQARFRQRRREDPDRTAPILQSYGSNFANLSVK